MKVLNELYFSFFMAAFCFLDDDGSSCFTSSCLTPCSSSPTRLFTPSSESLFSRQQCSVSPNQARHARHRVHRHSATPGTPCTASPSCWRCNQKKKSVALRKVHDMRLPYFALFTSVPSDIFLDVRHNPQCL